MAVQAESSPSPSQSAPAGQSGANARSSDPDPTPSSVPERSEQDARGPDFIREAFNRLRSQTLETHDTNPRRKSAPQAPPASASQGKKPERSAKARTPNGGARPATSPASTLPALDPSDQRQQSRAGTPPGSVTLTQEQYNRSVQSEVDRILAKREADTRTKQARDAEHRLRTEDPFEYVRQVEARESEEATRAQRTQEATGLLEQQIHQYDRGILDPLMGALPDAARKKILESVRAEGIPGRAEVVKHTISALRSIWQAEGRETARSSLMKDQTFIKEILARYGGQPDATNGNGNGQRGSPEMVSGLPPSSSGRPRDAHEAVNQWMRTTSTGIRGTSGPRGR